MALIVFLISLVTAAIGYFLSLLLRNEVTIDSIGSLTNLQILGLINGIMWFLVCYVVYFGSKKIDQKSFGLVSPSFFINWVFVNAGTIIGYLIFILVDQGELIINNDQIMDQFFLTLAITLGPALSATLGLKSNEK